MEDKKEILIDYLETVIEMIKSNEWNVDSYGMDMHNDIDKWASKINKKSININIDLKPVCKPKLEFKPIKAPVLHKKVHDDILDMIRQIPYTYYTPSLISPFDCRNNPYHRHCNQLEKHLKKHNIDCNVSRSSVGDKTYYNLDFKSEDLNYETSSDYCIRKLLDIKGVGLVSFEKIDNMYYKTILVDEEELDDKYMCNGDLKFKC